MKRHHDTVAEADTQFLQTPTDLDESGADHISSALRKLLADVFTLYLKTKNFHWHMSGHHFRDYHLLLDEQSGQILAMADDVAERTRKLGGRALRSVGDVSRHQQLKDNDEAFVAPEDMLRELCDDSRQFAATLRSVHRLCERYYDFATASLLETWIDETERRTWFLFETLRRD